MKFSNIERDAQVAAEGLWIEEIPNCEDLRLKVRGMNTTAFADAHGRRLRDIPLHRRAADGSLSSEEAFVALGHALADVVLLDWDNLQSDDGNPIEYDPESARKWLTDLNTADFQTAVSTAAGRVDLASRMAGNVEEAAKN